VKPNRHGVASNLGPNGAAESTMMRYLLAVTVAGALASAAHAQSPDTEDNRYQLNRVDDGYLRLDLKSGQLSLCNRREVGWACRVCRTRTPH
jgi:hypothetical protein